MKEWIKGLCPEIADWQAEMIAEAAEWRIAAEREECAKLMGELTCMGNAKECFEVAATYIRARGQQ
jgi:hypothetical protein